jgi:hypothetical protein
MGNSLFTNSSYNNSFQKKAMFGIDTNDSILSWDTSDSILNNGSSSRPGYTYGNSAAEYDSIPLSDSSKLDNNTKRLITRLGIAGAGTLLAGYLFYK